MEQDVKTSTFISLRSRLHASAQRLLANADDVNDALQELFVRVWQNKGIADTEGQRQAFMHITLRNICVDMLRRRRHFEDIDTSAEERNIAADDSEIDRAKLDYAARVANIYDFIQTLPLKYLTKIGNEGLGLSQGQKQRILIARAVYRSPEYIMLDEATNSLDASIERTIVDNLSEFFRGRTVIIIAHRLSTVRNADRIVVLDKGRIVETGNHDTLVQSRGVYFNLVKDQLELGH